MRHNHRISYPIPLPYKYGNPEEQKPTSLNPPKKPESGWDSIPSLTHSFIHSMNPYCMARAEWGAKGTVSTLVEFTV